MADNAEVKAGWLTLDAIQKNHFYALLKNKLCRFNQTLTLGAHWAWPSYSPSTNYLRKILIIQTAFIGDAVLATALANSFKVAFGSLVQVDMLVRAEVAELIGHCPAVHAVHVFNKREGRLKQIIILSSQFRAEKYEAVINLQRYMTTGLLTLLSGAEATAGFAQNPVSLFFARRLKHTFRIGCHETQRNLELAQLLFKHLAWAPPILIPNAADTATVNALCGNAPYVCLAPASVWATKRAPDSFWVAAAKQAPMWAEVCWLGGPADRPALEALVRKAGRGRVMAGELSLIQSADLMRRSLITFANDSGPVHLAAAVDASVCTVYCSTAPLFGFYPISSKSFVIEEGIGLHCRPCGLHGHSACPRGHFLCGKLLNEQIETVYAAVLASAPS